MPYLGLKGIEPEINDWLNSKPNKSQTTKTALRLLYQKELEDNYKKQNGKIEVKIIG